MKRSDIQQQEIIAAIDKEWFDYNDGDIFVVNDVNKLPQNVPGTIFINKVIVVACYQGVLSFKLNGIPFNGTPDDVIICYPDTLISDIDFSTDMRCLVFGFSVQAMENAFYANEKIWKTIFDVTKMPVIHLNEDEISLLYHFAAITKIKVAQTNNPMQKRMMHALLQAVLYEFFDIISRFTNTPIQESPPSRKVQIYREFIELLGQSNGRIRSVTDIAEELCITPKYLSSVVKQCSDKSPLEWIHHYTTNVIVQQLRYTDKSIKDISNELGFPSQAFFGKFVKTRLGLSPKNYREQFNK